LSSEQTMTRTKGQKVSICLLGDVSLNGYWEDAEGAYFSDEVLEVIQGHDVVLLNLESPVRGDGGENLLKAPRLGTTAAAIQKLDCLSPSVCVLANNHIYDHLVLGYSRTVGAVSRLGATAVGAGVDPEAALAPARFEVKGVRFSLLAYVGGETNPKMPSDAGLYLNMLEEDRIVDEIMRERQSGRNVIVSLHWGLEFYDYPAPWQRRLASKMAQAGARLIWGHHAHVSQGWERRGQTDVLYCMGNTVFDDVEGAVKWDERGRRSLLASIDVHSNANELAAAIQVSFLGRKTCRSSGVFLSPHGINKRLCSPLRLNRTFYRVFYTWQQMKFLLGRVWNYFAGDGRSLWRQALRLPARIFQELKE
jgi:poly-gamma-glutamate capsule biosynthesis protein CapA/YwtB (metallophosphatase superfamily)